MFQGLQLLAQKFEQLQLLPQQLLLPRQVILRQVEFVLLHVQIRLILEVAGRTGGLDVVVNRLNPFLGLLFDGLGSFNFNIKGRALNGVWIK